MDDDELDLLVGAVDASPDVDLPADRADLALLAEFLERNPDFDTSAPADKLDKLRALQGTDRDVYVPDGDTELDRLIVLLKRHDDLELLAKLLESDDTVALLEGLGHGTGGAAARSAGTTDADEDDDGGGWLSGDDEDDDDFLDHEDLDRFGEWLAYAAGGGLCLLAVLASWFQGITVYKDVDSWVLTVEIANSEVVVGVTAVAALVLGVAVGFVYRIATDEVHEGYRTDLAAATFEVPLFAFIAVGLLYLAAPVVLNLVNVLLVDALIYLVALAVLLVIFGMPLLVAVFVGVGAVVWLPTYAGIVGGSLVGAVPSALTS